MKKLSLLLIMIGLGLLLDAQTIAHWKFTPEHTLGSIEDGNLIIKDLSQHSNDLHFHVVKRNAEGHAVEVENMTSEEQTQLLNKFSWVNDVYGEENQKSLKFNTGAKNWDFGGYFETNSDAAINQEYFEGGYTIEVIFKMPEHFTSDSHKWTSIFRKKGAARQYQQTHPDFPHYLLGEPELLCGLDISNLKELQWSYYNNEPAEGSLGLDNQTSWSFSLADLNDWYHVTLINDGEKSEIYINGVTDFRNANPADYNMGSGMLPALEGYGWLVGATGYYEADADGDGIGEFPIKELFDGHIQELRFTKGALPQESWLYADLLATEHTEIGTNDDISLLNDEDNYNIIFIPDTQKPIRYQTEIVDEQMKWIADNKDENNLVFVNFLGDLVDRYNEQYEWNNILHALDFLKEGNVRFMTVDGNHDGYDGASMGGPYPVYVDYFNPEYYEGMDYYYNQSPSGYAAYSIIRGKDYTYLFISVSFYQTQYLMDLDWVLNVISQYHYLPVIFSTHQHLNFEEDGSGVYRVDNREAQPYFDQGMSMEDLFPYFKFAWERILKINNNVFMAMSGHHHGAGYQISENDYGNSVFEGVYDYQSDYHGGNGWMNFLEFDENNNTIDFRVFSPWVDQMPENERTYYDVKYRTQPEDYFTYNINFKDRFDFYPWIEINSIEENEVAIDYYNTLNIDRLSIVIYPKGSEAIPENQIAQVEITNHDENVGTAIFNLVNEGDYYAVIIQEGIYVPISNQLDFYFNPIKTEDVQNPEDLKIYPVPFSNKLTIKNANPINTVNVFNADGKLVKKCKLNSAREYTLSTQQLDKGVYIIEVITSKNKILKAKAVKK